MKTELRDKFAKSALRAILSNIDFSILGLRSDAEVDEAIDNIGKLCYLFADSLLKAREEEHAEG